MGESEKISEKISFKVFQVILLKFKEIQGFQGQHFKFKAFQGFQGFQGLVATLQERLHEQEEATLYCLLHFEKAFDCAVKVEVHQASVLSPILFVIVLEAFSQTSRSSLPK